MSALAPQLADHEIPREDHFVRLRGASWADYQRLLALRGEKSAPRIVYADGLVEIMSPSRNHEAIKAAIGRLIEAYCLHRGIEFGAYGSWTLQSRPQQTGLEPDECYVFGAVADPEVPDLAIEVVWTAGGIHKLDLYARLGVREVWIWRRGRPHVHLLRDGSYEPAVESEALRGIDLALLAACLDEPTTTRAITRFQAALRRE